MKAVSTRLEYLKNQYRTIYESLDENPRIQLKDLSTILGVNRNSASKLMEKAFEQEYVMIPQIRRCSYSNMKEYVYLANYKNPLKHYRQYGEDTNVTYHAVMEGFANFWIISKEKIDIKGDVLIEGLRSDYCVAFAPNHSWDTSIQVMQKKVKNFNPEEYEPKGIMKTHWNETIPWDVEYEMLFREFKFNLRKKLTPIMRKYLISGYKIYKFLEDLPKYCTIFTRYFPEGFSNYDSYLYVFETDYEDFIIELFSELPTSSFFFKVSDKLFLYTQTERRLVRSASITMPDIRQLHIPLLVDNLLEREILKSEVHSISAYYWTKNL